MKMQLRERILEACYQLLRPIARFLLRSGVSYREFDAVAKQAFVLVASTDYGIRGRPTNVSRIAAMTGIPRKEVKRLRDVVKLEPAEPWRRLGPPGDVLHGWFTDPAYRGANGRPAELSFDSGAATFSQLSRRYAGDIPPGALRAELLRLGVIEETPRGTLRPLQRHVVPSSFDEKLLTSISFSLYSLASTVAFNTDPKRRGKGRIERFVNNSELPRAKQPAVRAELRERIKAFSEDVDDFLAANEDPAQESGPAVGVGVFYYEEDRPDET